MIFGMKKYCLILFFTVSLNSLFAQVRFGNIFQPKEDKLELNYSNPKTYEIAEIKVQGSKFLDENALISLTGLKVGDQISIPGDKVSNALTKLWKQGIIGDVAIYASKVENNKVFLILELKERPRLSRIILEGVNKTEQSELDDQIKLIRGRVLTDALIKNAEITVKKFLIEKGFMNAEVKVLQENDTILANSVLLKIQVDKKKKVKVHTITFYGNDNMSKGKLKKKDRRFDIEEHYFRKTMKE